MLGDYIEDFVVGMFVVDIEAKKENTNFCFYRETQKQKHKIKCMKVNQFYITYILKESRSDITKEIL